MVINYTVCVSDKSVLTCSTIGSSLQSMTVEPKEYCLFRRWSLNWDQITPEIVVGSCPRSASDIDRIVDEAGISAVICLQVN